MPQENLVIVETTSGQVLRFVADHPERILSQLKVMNPEAYFQRSQLYFSHSSILAGVPCDKVATVRFEFPLDPGWAFPFGASRVELIDQDQFDSQVKVKRVQAKMVLQNAILGTDISILQRVNLVNGTALHFRVDIKTVPAAIRMQNVETATSFNTFFAFTKTGYILLNRAAIAFWHAFPGPLMAPTGAISFIEELTDSGSEAH